jgi:hypothetical protein
MTIITRDHWVEEHPGVGFMVVSGAFEVFAGALLLFAGAPGGWACFVIGCGVTVMSGAALLAFDIEIEPGMATLVAVTVVVGLFAMTSLYFTHRAEDLPRLLPGHDGDSQQLRALHGITSALFACIALRVAYLSATPRRASAPVMP